jgi:DNA repair photolyase
VMSRIMTPGSGFLQGYSHTLNPYVGCSFGCRYCYVRRMPVALFRKEPWGDWVDTKADAAARVNKEILAYRNKNKGPVTIFMSSSTDPYQPLEATEQVTRSILQAMLDAPPDFLFIQTRSPLVLRDLDLLQRMSDRLLVSMTIETDREEVRRAFAPSAPPLAARFRVLQDLREAGIPCQAAVAPVLPFSDQFAEHLYRHTDRVTVDDYELGDGSGGRRSRQLHLEAIYDALQEKESYSSVTREKLWKQLQLYFAPDQLFMSREGFLPPLSYRS